MMLCKPAVRLSCSHYAGHCHLWYNYTLCWQPGAVVRVGVRLFPHLRVHFEDQLRAVWTWWTQNYTTRISLRDNVVFWWMLYRHIDNTHNWRLSLFRPVICKLLDHLIHLFWQKSGGLFRSSDCVRSTVTCPESLAPLWRNWVSSSVSINQRRSDL